MQVSFRFTMMYASVVSKSAGGSLNAMCAFSPMPMRPTSMGAERRDSVREAMHSGVPSTR